MFNNYSPIGVSISESLLSEGLDRARTQEGIFGHNTGHFKLKEEKENTVIGVLGELLVRDVLNKLKADRQLNYLVDTTKLGSSKDLQVTSLDGKIGRELHVKTGLWKKWPSKDFEFGIHADQGIEISGCPLVLVSILKTTTPWPTEARIEGYVTSKELSEAKVIKRGERFQSSGVVSRTDNLITKIGDYKPVVNLIPHLFKG